MNFSTNLSRSLGCLLLVGGVAVAQESKAASYAAEVTATQLHLRAGPTSSYQSVTVVERGRKLLVRAPAAGGWAVVEVPGGFDAWVAAAFVATDANGIGTVTANRLLVRPRPSTRYHQLQQSLAKGETVKVLEERQEGDTRWLRIRAPQRIPLYCMAKYISKIGPASLAVAPVEDNVADSAGNAATVASGGAAADANAHFLVVERQVLAELKKAKSPGDLQPIRRTLANVNGNDLNIANQRRHLELERMLLTKRDELVISNVELAQKGMLADLEREIARIEEKYRKRIEELEDERRAKKGVVGHYVATGIVEHKPDLLGRTPGFQITEGGKLRYYLIAPAYDLYRFRGKRVGITGIMDRESGTGHFTIMVKRIEILSDN